MAAPGKLEYIDKKESRLRLEPWSTPTFDGHRGVCKPPKATEKKSGDTHTDTGSWSTTERQVLKR